MANTASGRGGGNQARGSRPRAPGSRPDDQQQVLDTFVRSVSRGILASGSCRLAPSMQIRGRQRQRRQRQLPTRAARASRTGAEPRCAAAHITGARDCIAGLQATRLVCWHWQEGDHPAARPQVAHYARGGCAIAGRSAAGCWDWEGGWLSRHQEIGRGDRGIKGFERYRAAARALVRVRRPPARRRCGGRSWAGAARALSACRRWRTRRCSGGTGRWSSSGCRCSPRCRSTRHCSSCCAGGMGRAGGGWGVPRAAAPQARRRRSRPLTMPTHSQFPRVQDPCKLTRSTRWCRTGRRCSRCPRSRGGRCRCSPRGRRWCTRRRRPRTPPAAWHGGAWRMSGGGALGNGHAEVGCEGEGAVRVARARACGQRCAGGGTAGWRPARRLCRTLPSRPWRPPAHLHRGGSQQQQAEHGNEGLHGVGGWVGAQGGLWSGPRARPGPGPGPGRRAGRALDAGRLQGVASTPRLERGRCRRLAPARTAQHAGAAHGGAGACTPPSPCVANPSCRARASRADGGGGR